jgi:uncharacterized protein (TIGR02145 family)
MKTQFSETNSTPVSSVRNASRSRRRQLRAVSTLAACLSLALAACGSDDDDEPSEKGGSANSGGSGAKGGATASGGSSGSTAKGGSGGSSTSGGAGGSTSNAGRGGSVSSGGNAAGGNAAGGAAQGGGAQAGSAGSGLGGSLGSGGQAPNTFTDPRDKQVYPTVTLGSQTWLAKNLNYALEGTSFCYGDNPDNCKTYGRLYLWSVAQTACPSGYKLASDADWKTLEATLGMKADQLNLEGYSTERGTDQGAQLRVGGSAGFNAPLAGYRASPGVYEALGDRTYIWTSSTSGSDVWRRRITGASGSVYRFTNPPATFGISVRCVKN